MTDQASSPQPGWYHAQGDPVGTQRYWDGTQWQGAPQPATVEPYIARSPHGEPIAYAETEPVVSARAEHGPRFIAALIDTGLAMGLWIAVIVVAAIGAAVFEGFGALLILFGFVSYAAFFCYNLFYLQGSKGQTIGKKSQNLKLIEDHTGGPIGIGKAIARWIASAIFNLFFVVDLIWILIDSENRTLSDKMLGIRVVAVRQELPTTRLG